MQVDVITVSTSRHERYGPVATPDRGEDLSGKLILEVLEAEGHSCTYRLLPDGLEPLRKAVQESKADAVVICGGTGLAPLDLTIEAVEPLYDKAIPGFGEIFRQQSLDQVGTKAILTRASAGVVDGVPVFCLPGSTPAAGLGVKLITAELEHIIGHLRNG